MPPSGEGFVIPARVVVTIEGLNRVKEQLQAFVSASKSAAEVGQRPIDPATGTQATVKRMQEEVGANLNAVRKAGLLVQQEIQGEGFGSKRRKELTEELKGLQAIEKQLSRNASLRRDDSGKTQPIIYPKNEPQYPTLSDVTRGVVPPQFRPESARSLAQTRPEEARPPIRPRQEGGVPKEDVLPAAGKVGEAERRLSAAQNSRREALEMLTATGRRAMEEEQALAGDRAKVRSVEAEIRSTDQKYLRATADAANAREEEAHRITILRTGGDPGDLRGEELRAKAALAQRSQADRDKALASRRATDDDIDSAARVKVENRKYELAVRQRQQQIVKDQLKSGEIAQGTWFQRLQSNLKPASGRLPEENLKAVQFLGEKFERTVGFAASGALLGMGTAAITEVFKDATQLEVTFVRLKGQLDGIGQSRSFDQVREQIRGVAADTGQTSNDVAQFFSRMVGLSNDPARAMNDTAAAMKLMTVTGLDMKSMLSSMVPIAKAFGVSAEAVGDTVVEMGERFGISEDDFVQFLGKTATVAKQAGLNFRELSIIGANMANSLGKPIESSSESLNKAFGQIENNMDKVFKVLQSNPETEAAIPKMIEAMGAGKPGQAMIELMKAYQKFQPGQSNAILTQIVSKREAEDFNAMMTNSGSILQQLQDDQDGAGNSAGKLNSRFRDMKETVTVTFKSINAAFESIGEVILRSGVGDALRDIGNALGIIVGVVGLAVSAFASLNDALSLGGFNNVLSGMARILLAMTAVVKLQDVLNKTRDMGKRITGQEAAAEGTDAEGKEANAVATNEAAAAQTRLNETRATSVAESGLVGVAGAAPAAGGLLGPTGAPIRSGVAAGEGGVGVAAQAGLLASGFRGRMQMKMPALGASLGGRYQQKFDAYAAEFGAAEAGTLRMTTIDRAFAGGRFWKAPAADAMAKTTGAATGLMASPLLTGALVVGVAGYAKSQYDEMARQAEDDNRNFITQLRQATEANVNQVAQIQDTWQDTFIASFTQTKTIGELGKSEKAFMESTTLRKRFGAETRPAHIDKAGEATNEYIAQTQESLNRRWAEAYTDETKQGIADVLGKTEIGRKIGLDTGVLEDTKSGFEKTIDFITGGTSAAKPIDIVGRRQAATPEDYKNVRAKLQTYKTERGEVPTEVTSAIEAIDRFEQGLGPAPELNALQTKLGESKDAAGLIASAGGNVEQAFSSMNKWGTDNFESLDELNKKLQTGEIGSAEYVVKSDEAIKYIRLAGERLKGPEAEKNRNMVRDTVKVQQDTTLAAASAAAEFEIKIKSVSTTMPKSAAQQAHRNALSTASRFQRLQALPQMLQDDIEAQQEEWTNIANPDQRLAAMNRGVQLSPEAIRTNLQSQFQRSLPATDMIKKLAAVLGKTEEEVSNEISKKAADEGTSVEEAARNYMLEQSQRKKDSSATLSAAGDHVGAAIAHSQSTALRANADIWAGAFKDIEIPSTAPDAARQALNQIQIEASKDEARTKVAGARAAGDNLQTVGINAQAAARAYSRAVRARNVRGGGVTDEQVQAAEAELIKSRKDEANAWFNFAQTKRQRQVILANRDPVLENAAKMAIAVAAHDKAVREGNLEEREASEQQIIQLEQEAAENQLNIVRGAAAIQAARDAEDPLKAATNALHSAELELAHSHGEADREQREAAVIAAQKGLSNAISAGLSADAQLAITLANLRGDSVAAATTGAEEAKRRLDEAIAKNITDRTVLGPLEGALAEANKQAFLAPINKTVSDVDYLYSTEQMSLGDAIAKLEGQLALLTYDSPEYRDLYAKIFGLKKQSKQDTQFNLPSDIELPTLYEARRLNQTRAMGVGYMDNRQIAMTFQINGAQDPAAITNQIVNAMQSVTGQQVYTPGVAVGSFN